MYRILKLTNPTPILDLNQNPLTIHMCILRVVEKGKRNFQEEIVDLYIKEKNIFTTEK